MKRVWGFVAVLVLACSVGATAQWPGQFESMFGLSRPFVSAGDSAYLMMPPVLVSEPSVEEAKWSPTGHYVAFQRSKSRITAKQITALMKPANQEQARSILQGDLGDIELMIYSRQGKLYSIWKGPVVTSRVVQMGWLRDDTLIVLTEAPENDKPVITPIVVRTSSGKPVTATLPKGSEWILEFSPTQASAVVGIGGGLYVVRSTGGDSSVSVETKGLRYRIHWSADGIEPFIAITPDGEEKKFHAFSASELMPLDKKPDMFERGRQEIAVSAKPSLKLTMQQTTLKREDGSGVVESLWLEVTGQKGKGTPGLVSGDVTMGELSPAGDAVLYVTADGAAFVRSLVPVDANLVKHQGEQAMRANLMNWGSQIAVSLQVLAADNEDGLPSAAEFQEKIKPYLSKSANSDHMLEMFHYTAPAATLGGIERWGETILGYIPGPGGFVAVYADCHSEWKTGEPPE